MGKIITTPTGDNFTVTGVLKTLPVNSQFKFRISACPIAIYTAIPAPGTTGMVNTGLNWRPAQMSMPSIKRLQG
jgi:hypothetical protein